MFSCLAFDLGDDLYGFLIEDILYTSLGAFRKISRTEYGMAGYVAVIDDLKYTGRITSAFHLKREQILKAKSINLAGYEWDASMPVKYRSPLFEVTYEGKRWGSVDGVNK